MTGMKEQTKCKNPRAQIDSLLNCIQIDLDSVSKAVLETKRTLLGLEIPTPEEKVEKEEKAPRGWLNRIIRMLDGFGKQLRSIQQFQNEILNTITEDSGLEKMDEQLEARQKEQ